jgi:6-phosphogluconolactonase
MFMNWKKFVCAIAAVGLVVSLAPAAPRQELVFVGSGRANIESFHLDLDSGVLTHISQAASIAHPSFFAVAPNHRFLYSITEGHDVTDSSVTAFAVDTQAGKLNLLNSQPASGAGPCYVDVDASGKNVLIANYGSGSVAVFPLTGIGRLNPVSAFVQDHGASVNPDRQTGPHAHCIVTDPANRFALACDLGLDKVLVFRFDPADGTLRANKPPFVATKPGAGPRHLAFHPNGRWVYVSDEMGSALTAYDYDAKAGTLREIQSESTLPKNFTGENTDAEVAVHPLGKFVYCSNRGDDSIAIFGCDADTGRVTFLDRVPTGGKTPRQFVIDPTGAWLLAGNQDSNTVVVFRIDTATGHLQPAGAPVQSDNPMCIQCLPPE